MKSSKNCLFLLAIFALFFTACVSEDSDNNFNKNSEDNEVSININGKDGESIAINIDNIDELEDAFKEIGKAFKEAGKELDNVDFTVENEDGKKIETVEAKDLKKVLPRNIAGLPKEESSANKSGIFGFNVATVEATYQEDDEKVEITIIDVGGMGKLANKWADWTNMEIDKEKSDGSYERTTTIEGHKAFEKYEAKYNRYELAAFAYNRFVVTLKGKNVKLGKLKSAFEDIEEELDDLR